MIPKKEEGKNCKAFYNLVLGAPRLPLPRALLEVSYLVLAAPRDREMGAWLRLLKGGVSKDLWPLEKNLCIMILNNMEIYLLHILLSSLWIFTLFSVFCCYMCYMSCYNGKPLDIHCFPHVQVHL